MDKNDFKISTRHWPTYYLLQSSGFGARWIVAFLGSPYLAFWFVPVLIISSAFLATVSRDFTMTADMSLSLSRLLTTPAMASLHIHG